MNENINLQVEKENLDAAFSILGTQLKVYATAKINYEKAKVGRFGKDVIEAFNNMNKSISSYIEKQAIEYQKLKYERQLAKQEKEREKRIIEAEKLQEKERKQMTEQRKKDMKYALKQDRKLKFKNSLIQKTSSMKSKLGRVKSAVLGKVMTRKSNFDLKVKNAFTSAEIQLVETMTDIVNGINDMRDNVSKYTTAQIENYHAWRYEKELAKQEKEREKRIIEAEKLQEEQRKMMTEQRKADMEYALEQAEEIKNAQRAYEEEQQRLEQETEERMKEAEKLQEQERKEMTAQRKEDMIYALGQNDILKFKEGVSQKASTIKSRLGTVKSAILGSVMPHKSNFDLKVQNAFIDAQVTVTGFVATGVEKVNNTRENISKYTTSQIEKYQAWKYERQLEKEEKEREKRIIEAEKLQEEQRKMMTEQRKNDMEYALEQAELEEKQRIEQRKADVEYALNQAERQQLSDKNKELIEKLREEKERLVSGVNTLINNNEHTEEIVHARGM